jgi:hypothetical protein
MTRFGKEVSDAVRQETNSPGLIAVLKPACESGAVTRKQIAAAADFSLTTAYRIVENGWREYDQVQGLLDHLPEAEALAVASDVCRRFKVCCREADGRGVGMADALRLAGRSVALAETINDADSDKFRSSDERAAIQQGINEIRAQLDRLEAANAQPVRRVV